MIVSEKIGISSMLAIGGSILIFFGINNPKEQCYSCDLANIKKATELLRNENTFIVSNIADTLHLGKEAIAMIPKIEKQKDSLTNKIVVLKKTTAVALSEVNNYKDELAYFQNRMMNSYKAYPRRLDTVRIFTRKNFLGRTKFDTIKTFNNSYNSATSNIPKDTITKDTIK